MRHVHLPATQGVDPTDTSTYSASEHVLGYDRRRGWLRQPACSLAQFYLATHPTLVRLHVGLYARLLKRELKRGRLQECGLAAMQDPVRCCVELSIQMCAATACKGHGGCKTDTLLCAILLLKQLQHEAASAQLKSRQLRAPRLRLEAWRHHHPGPAVSGCVLTQPR